MIGHDATVQAESKRVKRSGKLAGQSQWRQRRRRSDQRWLQGGSCAVLGFGAPLHLLGPHARARHALKQALDLWGHPREGVAPEGVARVLDELDEGYEQTPGVRAVDDEALQQHPRDLLLDQLAASLGKEEEQGAGEVVGVDVGVPQVVGQRVDEEVPALCSGGSRDQVSRWQARQSEWRASGKQASQG